jgi:uncharacterized protein (TIGR00725 family)
VATPIGSAGLYLSVVGPSEATPDQIVLAYEVGRCCAEAGAVVVTGGLGGIMEAACQGATFAGGVTVGLLPGSNRRDGNEYLTVALPTGIGELRNGLVVRAADAVIVVGGSWGTMSEIALALRTGRTVVGLGAWPLPVSSDDFIQASTAEEAVRLAIERRRQRA